VILVGEMARPRNTGSAITRRRNWSPVFSTLHTVNAPQTIERIIDIYPSDQQNQIRSMLSNSAPGGYLSNALPPHGPTGHGCRPSRSCSGTPRRCGNCIREIPRLRNPQASSRPAAAPWGMQYPGGSSIKQLFVNGYISKEDGDRPWRPAPSPARSSNGGIAALRRRQTGMMDENDE